MTAHTALEHQEHAEHAAHSGGNKPALLVAVLAALLAVCEQRAKHAEIRLEESSIGATDSWGQYQAKSTRAMIAKDLADVFGAAPATSADDRQTKIIQRLRDDADHYEHGTDGKDAIAKHAKDLEEERDHAIEETHAYDNAAASLELGIVLGNGFRHYAVVEVAAVRFGRRDTGRCAGCAWLCGAYDCGALGRKDLFFEKKKQETFTSLGRALQQSRSPIHKSFLVLFFKKEHLPF